MKFLNILFATFILFSCTSQNKTKNNLTNIDSSMNLDSLASCSPNTKNSQNTSFSLDESSKNSLAQHLKSLNPDLPIIGLLMYDDVLTTELTAPMDVFTKQSEDGKQLFNVITIAERYEVITSEEGLKMFPDYILENAPKLDILIVPSAYDMSLQVKNRNLVEFIKKQNQNTDYTVSNCAGATLIGESGIADGKKIVTWIGGGKELQKNYPNLKVQNDGKISYMEDGKFLSSNGNLASYISSLELLEKLSSKEHRKFVESYLYLDRLQNWKK
ncbi:DJ-1/PfpI family protein [Bernardetia sp.]|uniref:DJ-1/PfpI family protein n=1 Tax=Bernardetia sp. TaxID=1937974 RepID=UPI0025C27BC1|nr:DJ-1/PfpI family protein [Bernardetia sp.]